MKTKEQQMEESIYILVASLKKIQEYAEDTSVEPERLCARLGMIAESALAIYEKTKVKID